MPSLNDEIIQDLTGRLVAHLLAQGRSGVPTFLNAGGSAAVFKVDTLEGPRAYKVIDPRFLTGETGAAERRRLRLQEKIIGHSCPHLVEMHSVTEAENTAFIEMEFCSWPQLSKNLEHIPDDAVAPLAQQLVSAVRYLEEMGIVHRDIKPENIHVAPDFRQLKLLDLGVARTFDASEAVDAEITDHNQLRPFLATAQYSSPEYLFRLDEPTPKLWRALNLYQVGAVLHDLIMKTALFQDEVNLGNRWLVARAVLAQTPSFAEASRNRLASLKALAAKCLAKDMDVRLQIVSWSDFTLDSAQSPLDQLRSRLERRDPGSLDSSAAALESRLHFDRATFQRSFIERVRIELIATCGNKLPLTVIHPSPESSYTFDFSYSPGVRVQGVVEINWLQELYSRTANIRLGDSNVCVVTISEAEDQAVFSLTHALAVVAGEGLDLVESGSVLETKGRYMLQSNLGSVEVD